MGDHDIFYQMKSDHYRCLSFAIFGLKGKKAHVGDPPSLVPLFLWL